MTLSVPLIQGGANRRADSSGARAGGAGRRRSSRRSACRSASTSSRRGSAFGRPRGDRPPPRDALANTRDRLRLAEGRYTTGVGSIIELGDAQVALTTAAAQRVSAQYQLYNGARAAAEGARQDRLKPSRVPVRNASSVARLRRTQWSMSRANARPPGAEHRGDGRRRCLHSIALGGPIDRACCARACCARACCARAWCAIDMRPSVRQRPPGAPYHPGRVGEPSKAPHRPSARVLDPPPLRGGGWRRPTFSTACTTGWTTSCSRTCDRLVTRRSSS